MLQRLAIHFVKNSTLNWRLYNASYESKKNEVKLIKGESPAKPF